MKQKGDSIGGSMPSKWQPPLKITQIRKQTWTALFFKSLVDKNKVHHHRAGGVGRVGKHVVLF